MARPKQRHRYATMRFVLWALKLDHVPSVDEICTEFDVCEVSARCWRRDWLDVRAPQLGAASETHPEVGP